MKKLWLAFLIVAYSLSVNATFSLSKNYICTDTVDYKDPFGILQSGNIDLYSNGYLRSSTEVFHFNVGNPEKFYVPFYFLVGANVDIDSEDKLRNEVTAFDLLNNMGGYLNVGVNGRIKTKLKSQVSQLHLIYQVAFKSISGYTFETGNNEKFLSKMFMTGMNFSSKAWMPEQSNSEGQFFIRNALAVSLNPKDKIKAFWSDQINSTFVSYIFEAGLQLKNSLNLKFVYYQFINNTNYEFIDGPGFKLTADVRLK